MKVKGTAISFFPEYIQSRYGNDKLSTWINALPPASKEIFSKPVLASSWYSFHDGMAVPLRSICDAFHGGNSKGAWEVGRYSADFGLRGIYKIFVKLGSPEKLAERAADVLPKYYDPCSMEIVSAQKGAAVLRVTNFPESNDLTEARLAGYMERGVEICGGKSVKIATPAAMSRGNPYTEYRIEWAV